MADRFRWDGREFDVVERPTWAEAAWIERQSGMKFSELTESETNAAGALISLRRAGVAMTWAEFMEKTSPADFEAVDGDDVDEADGKGRPVPTTPGGEAGRKRRGGRTASTAAAAAAADAPRPPSRT